MASHSSTVPVVLLKEAPTQNSGHRIANPAKGLFIKNGRKVIVK